MGISVKSYRLWLVALSVALVLVACNKNSNDLGQTSLLRPFESAAEYSEFTKQFEFGRSSGESTLVSGTPDTTLNFSAGSSSENFSRTNIQEEGVDEPDVVKTDGEYLYIASADRVNIVDAVPATNMC